MGGSAGRGNVTPAAEFNIYCDPEAADIVFNSHIPITMVGLDVARGASLTYEAINKLQEKTKLLTCFITCSTTIAATNLVMVLLFMMPILFYIYSILKSFL